MTEIEEIKIGDLVEIQSRDTIHLKFDGFWEDAEYARKMRIGIVIGIEKLLDEWYNKQPVYKPGLFVVLTEDGQEQKYFANEIRKVASHGKRS